MNRVKRIASRGWLGKALSVLTFGYFPYQVDIPIVDLTTAPRDFSLTTADRDFDLTTDGRDFSLTNERSFALTTTRNFNLTYSRD